MSRSRLRVAALTLAAALAVASCSSDDNSADTVPVTEAAAETSGATDTSAAPVSAAEAPDAPTTEPTTEPEGDFDPYAQALEWSPCDVGECAEATVPIDYDDPSAGTTTIAMARQAAAGDPADRVGTLFVNPGGPGESGIEFLVQLGSGFGTPILESFDIVGFDPRGVGQSDPLECLDDAGLDEYVTADVDPDDPASVEAYGELVNGMGEACLDTNPELAQHVTTVETAKDIDVLRALVGDDELYYFGGSYGTFLGATYAALFPDRVGRMVLDGAVDPSIALIQNDLRQAGGFQLAFDDYAADCAANGCPLGATLDEIEQSVTDVFDAALADPLPTDDPDRPLTRSLAMFGVIAQLYSEFDWPTLTDAIVAAGDGDGTALLAAADVYWQRTPGGYTTNTAEANKAITCLDAPLTPAPDDVPTEDDFIAASSVFGEIYYGLVEVECEAWPIEPSVGFPDYTAPGAAPILVIGTTGDPATPIESAYALADELESGVLLVREGEGHTAYFAYNPCINDLVDAYLAEGAVPDDETECPEVSDVVTEDGSADAPAAEQQVSFVAGDAVVQAAWTSCAWDGTVLTLAAEGDGVQVETTTGEDGTIEITITGDEEWTMIGTGEDVEGTLVVSGTATAADGTEADGVFVVDTDGCT